MGWSLASPGLVEDTVMPAYKVLPNVQRIVDILEASPEALLMHRSV